MARLALLLTGVFALAPGRSATAADAPSKDGRRHLTSIEVDAAGTAGVIRTQAEYLGEKPGELYFGGPHCAGTRIGTTTLEQLHQALRTKQLVTLTPTKPSAGGEHPCLDTVTFWAPET